MSIWTPYGSIPSITKAWSIWGHRMVWEEKIDGWQCSFAVDEQGRLRVWSKTRPVSPRSKAWKPLCEALDKISHRLSPLTLFRGEYLSSPKMNVLTYERLPPSLVVVFDAMQWNPEALCGEDLGRATVGALCQRAGLLQAPALAEGHLFPEDLESWKGGAIPQSCLGGPIEGIVLKARGVRSARGGFLKAKAIREEFSIIARGPR